MFWFYVTNKPVKTLNVFLLSLIIYLLRTCLLSGMVEYKVKSYLLYKLGF